MYINFEKSKARHIVIFKLMFRKEKEIDWLKINEEYVKKLQSVISLYYKSEERFPSWIIKLVGTAEIWADYWNNDVFCWKSFTDIEA